MDLIRFILLAGMCMQISSGYACKNASAIPADGDCRGYLQCEDDVWVKKYCDQSNLNFDPDTNSCRKSWEFTCHNAPKKCQRVGETMQVPGDCGSYFKCNQDGMMTKESCGKLYRYDTTTESCRFFWQVDCSSHMECQTDVIFPVENSGNEYEICRDGKYVRSSCSDGQYFYADKGSCVPKEYKSEECTNGRVEPVVGDCSKYYSCNYGRKQEQKCWFFQRFNPQTLRCEMYWDVDCNLGPECKSGDKAPSGECDKFYQCEFGYWKSRTCGTTIGIPTYFDQYSKNCLITNYNCSTAECSIEGLKVEMPGDCSKYRTCRDSRFHVESCGHFQKFDTETKRCKYVGVSCTSRQDRPSCFPNERVSVDDSCYTYRECIDGQYERRMCLYPLFRFDKSTLTCRFMVDCNKNCYENELRAVPGKCNSFLVCHNGAYVSRTCPLNNFFDVVTSSCVQQKYATCA